MKLLIVILTGAVIIQSLRLFAYKKGMEAIALYLKDIDAIPDEETVDKYSRTVLKKSKKLYELRGDKKGDENIVKTSRIAFRSIRFE